MDNTSAFFAAFYEQLYQVFGANQDNTTYVQLGWPGIQLSPADFKLPTEPTGAYDAASAQETLSWLANIAPLSNALRFQNSGYEIDDLYQILLFGATPVDHNAATVKLFNDAQYEFSIAQKGSNREPSMLYYPSLATPVDWYTETNAQNWTQFSMSSSQVPTPDNNARFFKYGGKELLDKGAFKLAPENTTESELKTQLFADVAKINNDYKRTFNRPDLTTPVTRPAELMLNTSMTRLLPTSLHTQPLRQPRLNTLLPSLVSNPNLRTNFTTSASALNNKVLAPSVLTSKLAKPADYQLDTQTLEIKTAKPITLNKKLLLKDILLERLPTRPIEPATTGLSVSFQYCKVLINRFWYKNALLNMPNWYMTGTERGFYSSGSLADVTKLFPLLPQAFIAIRNLRVSANWSNQDRANLSRAQSLGPFSLQGGSMAGNTLSAPGLQIIAWVSRLNTVYPPQPAP